MVLDSSAILAVLNREPGADLVVQELPEAVVSTVNVAEVATRLYDYGMPDDEVRSVIADLDLDTVSYDGDQAFVSAMLRPATRVVGLSLGDRACLGLARIRSLPALTADAVWSGLDIGVEIRLIR
jgi:PIN domain nuclease of toxin-antitoxin system